MDPDDVLSATRDERLGLADQLDDLGDDEWGAASLCSGWTTHDVLAHLSLTTRLTPLQAIGGMLRARFDINRMIGDAARSRSAVFPPAGLIAQLRETAGSAHRPLGTQVRDPLVDILVHGQDILRPLGRPRAIPAERAVPALAHVWSSSFYGAAKRFTGLRFVPTDADGAVGDGDLEVRGAAGELLLVATGRTAGLAALDGPGAAEATDRLTGLR